MILEGIDERTLRRAVGHIPGTPLPGQPGNVALAGHRDTFFRSLQNIRIDDEITLETLSGVYSYRVDSTEVVDPGETRVLDNSDDETLTLVTCYPFSFVGNVRPRKSVVRPRCREEHVRPSRNDEMKSALPTAPHLLSFHHPADQGPCAEAYCERCHDS
jgi:sortase A